MGFGTFYDQSCGVIRGLCWAHTVPIESTRSAGPYMKRPASVQAMKAENIIARHAVRALKIFRVACG